jgi:hypothetical protein
VPCARGFQFHRGDHLSTVQLLPVIGKMRSLQTLCLITALFILPLIHGNQRCVEKSYGEGRIVCVCNENYCDDLDEVILEPSGSYSLYTSSMLGSVWKGLRGHFSRNRGQVQLFQNLRNFHDLE